MKLLTPIEVAKKLGITRWQVYQLIKSGKLSSLNIASGAQRKYHRITEEELERFING